MQVSNETTNKQLLYGDFDKDGIHNLDDKKPFDKSSHETVNYDGILLTDDFKEIERRRRIAAEYVAQQKKRYPEYSSRVKDTVSIVHKILKTNKYNTNDFVGRRKEAEYKKQSEKDWKAYNKKVGAKKKETDNKYKTNLKDNNPYRAFHTNTKVKFKKEPFGVEAQFRTHKFGELNDAMHERYKKNQLKGSVLRSFRIKSKELIKKGY